MTSDESLPATTVATRPICKRTKLTDRELEMECYDLIARVKDLLTTHQLWGPDGTYTFGDGERWAKLEEDDNE